MVTQVANILTGENRQALMAGVIGLAAFYVLALDQGLILSLVQGDFSYVQNLVHETLHDARHAAGFPCH